MIFISSAYKWILSLCVTGLLLCSVPTTQAAFIYDVRILPHYLDTNYMTATGVSSAGHVVGQINHEGKTKGYVWFNEQITLIDAFGGTTTSPADVNSSGVVVGTARTVSGVDHGFRWQNGSVVEYVPPTGAGEPSSARAINDAGTIVGAVLNFDRFGASHEAWKFPGTSLHSGLGNWFGIMDSFAEAISDDGQTIVGSQGSPVGSSWVRYEGGNSIYLNSLLPGIGLPQEFPPQGVNNDRMVVGLGWIANLQTGEWTRFDQPGQYADLKDINNFGLAVGDDERFTDGGADAIIWKDGIRQIFQDVADVPAGYRLNSAFAVNDRGMIVGLATNLVTNRNHAFIATVPEASSLALGGIAVLAIFGVAWRQRRTLPKAAAFLLFIVLASNSAHAGQVELQVDSTRSYLELEAIADDTLSGNVPPFTTSDFALDEVFPGSMRTTLSGTISIVSDGSSFVDATSIQLLNYGYQTIFGNDGGGSLTPAGLPAEMSFIRDSHFASQKLGAIDDILFTLVGSAELDAVDSNGLRYFEAILIGAPLGVADLYNPDVNNGIGEYLGLFHTKLGDSFPTNFADEQGSLRINGELIELEIPVEFYIESSSPGFGVGFEYHKLTGVIVATAAVPEASSLALGGIAVLAIFGVAWRQRRTLPKAAALMLLTLVASNSAQAGQVEMTVDSTRSYLELTGIGDNRQPPFGGSDFPLLELFPGSLKSALVGQMLMSWEGGSLDQATSLTFGQALSVEPSIVAQQNLGPNSYWWGNTQQFAFLRELELSPGIFEPSGIDLLEITVRGNSQLAPGNGNSSFDVSSLIQVGRLPIPIGGLYVAYVHDPNLGVANLASDLWQSQFGETNTSTGHGLLQVTGNSIVVDIPIEMYVVGDDIFKLTGQITATAVVPEVHGAILMSGAAIMGLGIILFHRCRSSFSPQP